MNFLFVLSWCVWAACRASAYSPFQSWFAQGASCVDVINYPQCNSMLADVFRSQKAPSGSNYPETGVFLYTPTNQVKAEPLHLCGGTLPPVSTYDPKCNTEIFVHGYLDGICRTSWIREMKEQLFQRDRGCYNVILIDWTWGSSDYSSATANSQIVGEQIGFVINNIMQATGTGPDKFHVIGHNVGAIVAGYIGRSVKGLRRITGLDPSYRGFMNAPPNQRLTYRDAQIVDIIHSNAGGCKGFGDSRLLGHADFFPNGGASQTSSYSFLLQSLIQGDYLYGLAGLTPGVGAHLQAAQFYKVSINSRKCEFASNGTSTDWAVMGMDYEEYRPRNTNSRKKYILNTGNICPYYDTKCLGGNSALGGSCLAA